jgi:hypothetical protein
MSGQKRSHLSILAALAGILAAACSHGAASPAAPSAAAASQQVDATHPGSAEAPSIAAWGPETPNFNLEVILRGDDGGFGNVKFRQPNDAELVVHLDTWVRDLRPLTSYVLQRATDSTIDGVCTGTNWLTLGKGSTPQAITTDERGTGREDLFRNLSAFPVGSTFDITFRVLEQSTSAVVLTSGCYQFTISQ